MQSVITFRKKEDSEYDEIVRIFPFEDELNIEINMDIIKNLKDIFNKDAMIDLLKKEIVFYEEVMPASPKEKKDALNTLKKAIKKIDDVLSNIESISFSYDELENIDTLDNTLDEIVTYYQNNPIIYGKKIILCKQINITDYDYVLKLINKFAFIIDDVYVPMQNNRGYTKLKECFDTINKIRQVSLDIKKLNLSPIEEIMYTYDIVRNRVYTEESADESGLESRNLTNILNGDKIVCVGYSNYFNAILTYLGISSFQVLLDNSNKNLKGHQRDGVYIKDNKYHIDGVYYFDVTYDSKSVDETNDFLYGYRFFAKTSSEFLDIDKDMFSKKDNFNYSKEILKNTITLFKSGNYEKIYDNYRHIINQLSLNILGERIINPIAFMKLSPYYGDFDKEKFIEDIKFIMSKVDKMIYSEQYIKILNNVRKVQYLENPEFYPYSVDSIYSAYVNSKWQFKVPHYGAAEELILAIFNEKPEEDKSRDNKKEDFKNYIEEINLRKDINEVKAKITSSADKIRKR